VRIKFTAPIVPPIGAGDALRACPSCIGKLAARISSLSTRFFLLFELYRPEATHAAYQQPRG